MTAMPTARLPLTTTNNQESGVLSCYFRLHPLSKLNLLRAAPATRAARSGAAAQVPGVRLGRVGKATATQQPLAVLLYGVNCRGEEPCGGVRAPPRQRPLYPPEAPPLVKCLLPVQLRAQVEHVHPNVPSRLRPLLLAQILVVIDGGLCSEDKIDVPAPEQADGQPRAARNRNEKTTSILSPSLFAVRSLLYGHVMTVVYSANDQSHARKLKK
eukprot:CAMPEP_0118944768 /NCGR_PEP_ID=MMETSP1169-20130426/40978_1 /TAXON_ID=36882 /ORGANISM="Pyramimonas obovata, Strain CCMP722" /LENGTH=212 /DNA_ID=CAMNT_0006890327 /DNA_START=63 /DNA_END=703 /DNA_ORIENTATION=-